MSKWTGDAADQMGGRDEAKPKKVIKHIQTSKSDTKGDHVHIHHHTHPDHHPAETHTTRGDKEMAAHMMENMGAQSDPAAAAQSGAPDPNAAAGAAPVSAAPGGAMAAGTPAPAGM